MNSTLNLFLPKTNERYYDCFYADSNEKVKEVNELNSVEEKATITAHVDEPMLVQVDYTTAKAQGNIKHWFKSGTRKITIAPFSGCNYNCAHCFQIGDTISPEFYRTHKHRLLKAAKAFVKYGFNKDNPIDLFIMGGEVTLLPIEELTELLGELETLNNVQSIQIITNNSCSADYIVSLVKHVTKTDLYLIASFHDSIVTSKVAQQTFFKKLLLASVYGARTSVSVTIDRRNQDRIASLERMNRLYSAIYVFLQPLVHHRNLYDFKKGYVPLTKKTGDIGILRRIDVCSGVYDDIVIGFHETEDKIVVRPACTYGMFGDTTYKVDLKDLPLSDIDDYTEEDFAKHFEIFNRPLACNSSRYHQCKPCKEKRTLPFSVALELGIPWYTATFDCDNFTDLR